MKIPSDKRPRIVIIGGGFAGLEVAQKLRNKPFQLVLLDKNNYFNFQPLLYQVATSGLEPNSIAYPLRRVFRSARNIFFRMTEVERITPEDQTVHTSIGPISYDYLVVATGSMPNYFGLDPSKLLPLKSVPQALQLRNHILVEFEKALLANEPEEIHSHTNFVVVGGGPTGVELAGALGEMKNFVLPRDYPELDFSAMNIHLVEGADRVLPPMSQAASARALQYLKELGVEVHLKTLVKEYNGKTIDINGQAIPSRNLIWTAGVKAASLPGLEPAFGKSGRLKVDAYSRLEGFPNIFAIGDVAEMASEEHPKGHPMLAPVAIQQGRLLARNLLRLQRGQQLKPFDYFDKGTMATVGRNRAVADWGKLRLSGFFAWLAWMFVHLFSLVGFRNKLVVLVNWVYNYFTYDKALRLIIKRGKNQEEAFVETPVEAETAG
ncbi:MAG: NAD(P)/FAD-dependent oxidoreductase [Phaeodactylibacter sp.]|nr:NAD(P)/FAD-dependent oxidoreductase [Phaeodactylibacter sp.]MCB9274812.1 NAD(P)/FAD-dependent oxidoreductase [Lewinellaceae bacterium]